MQGAGMTLFYNCSFEGAIHQSIIDGKIISFIQLSDSDKQVHVGSCVIPKTKSTNTFVQGRKIRFLKRILA